MALNIPFTFSPGAIVFASQFNSNFSSVKSWADAHELATTAVHGVGSGAVVGTTLTQELTNKTITGGVLNDCSGKNLEVTSFAGKVPGDISNLGVTYASGTLTVCQANGSALSTSDKGYVCVNSATPGRIVNLEVTANSTLDDDAATSSDLTTVTFGVVSGRDWAVDMPFALYVVNKGDTDITAADGTSKFMLSRNFAQKSTPASATLLGDNSAVPSAPTDLNCCIILGTVTKANYLGLPLTLVGFVRMRWSSSTTDWTIQTLQNFNDGLGPQAVASAFATTWAMAPAQNGAASGSTSYFSSAGTLPAFTNLFYNYQLQRNGMYTATFSFNGDAGTDGSGANDMILYSPYPAPSWGVSHTQVQVGICRVSNPTYTTNAMLIASSGAYSIQPLRMDAFTTTVGVHCAAFTNGSRLVSGSYELFAGFAN